MCVSYAYDEKGQKVSLIQENIEKEKDIIVFNLFKRREGA